MKTTIWNKHLKCNQVVNYTAWSTRKNTATAFYPSEKERTYYGIKVNEDVFLWWKSRKTAIKYAYLFHTRLYEKAQYINGNYFTFKIHINPWTLYRKRFEPTGKEVQKSVSKILEELFE